MDELTLKQRREKLEGRVHRAERAEAKAQELQEQIATLDTEIERLREALTNLIAQSRSYMKYHNEKFYEGNSTSLSGLYPAIEEAERALENESPAPDGPGR